MLQLLTSYLRLNTFNDEFTPDSLIKFFDTELVDMIKYLYSDHRLNYDRLYKQEQINNIYKVKQDKKENYEQHIISYCKKNFNLSHTLVTLISNNGDAYGYGDIVRYSNYIEEHLKIWNKLWDENISLENLKEVSELNLIVDSVKNYYYGSIYDLLYDPIWSMINYFSEEYYLHEDDINKAFQFKYDSIYNITKLTKVFKLVMMDVLKCIYQYSNSSTLSPKIEKILRKSLNSEEEVSKWMFIVYDIMINGRLKGILKNTDKEIKVLDTYYKLYRDNGVRFIYEIGGV
jgi:hypothetical protein